MIDSYDPAIIEPKWQAQWEKDGLYRQRIDRNKPKHYALTMLPYPSGELHIGHWYAMTPSDARARFKRMNGYNVLFPMGFDAFGLPAENAAIERNVHPQKWTYANIEKMRNQLRSMGAMFDWKREAISADPSYYRWTQWLFKKLLELDLAYRKMAAVDFCPNCNTTLAREQVWGDDRHCERCKTPVIKKDLEQWFFRITDYAEELLDFSQIDWPERVKVMQTNWIGRSSGADVTFRSERGDPIPVFTTRPDTLWGATFMVLAPEHPLVDEITTESQANDVLEYRAQAERMSEIDRETADRAKTGVFTGAYAVNPVNGERIPIWIADYVLMTYGSGAIMAVPAHDERDFEFALKFGLPILPVINRPDRQSRSLVRRDAVKEGFEARLQEKGIRYSEEDGLLLVSPDPGQIGEYSKLAQEHLRAAGRTEVVGCAWLLIYPDKIIGLDSLENERLITTLCNEHGQDASPVRTAMEYLWRHEPYRDVLYHHQYGTMIASGEFSGTPGDSAVEAVVDWLEARQIGRGAINYRLRDWLISRQRYWGAPIPIIYCPDHGPVPVPDEQLPVLLPEDVEFVPTGESPLKFHESFLHTACPICGEPSLRETDTMDTFMCSSWYQYRYLSPNDEVEPFDPEEGAYWLPVDQYTGGIEHATMHLIYTRFFTKAMREMGLVDHGEPMKALYNQGMVLGEDGEKMSKSRGNVISPDALVQQYGADTVRTFLMFFSRWDYGGPWNFDGIKGPQRLLKDIWELSNSSYVPSRRDDDADRALRRKTHQAIRKVTSDLEAFSFNTAVAAIMELRNLMIDELKSKRVDLETWREAVDTSLLLLSPFAPHISEELWSRRGHPYSIHQQAWPVWDDAIAREEMITLVVQVNGRVRDKIEIAAGTDDEELRSRALASEKVQKWIAGTEPRKVIVVKGRLVNVVV
jgi:leucyl-tRNA synthetase